MADDNNKQFEQSYTKEQKCIRQIKEKYPNMIVTDYQFRSGVSEYKEKQNEGYDACIIVDGKECDVDFKCTDGICFEILQGNTSNPKANRLFGEKEVDRPIIFIDDVNKDFFYAFNTWNIKNTNIYKYYISHTAKQIVDDSKMDVGVMGLPLICNRPNEPSPGVFMKVPTEWFVLNDVPLYKYYPKTMTIEKVKE